MKFELWQVFVLGAVLSWGVYVPVLHQGQSDLGGGRPGNGAARAFLCVGVAYFLTAVVIPLIALSLGWAGDEPLDFTHQGAVNWRGITFATLGGVAGAAGALCIIFSLKNGGLPRYVAPLVFAGAPIVNAIVSLLWHPPKLPMFDSRVLPGWLMFGVGLLLAAAGAGLVLFSKGYIDTAERQARVPVPPAPMAQAPVPEKP